MLSLLIAAIQARLARARERRALRSILDKDDRTLSDIGLTRSDVNAALSDPKVIDARAEAFRLSRLANRPFGMF